MATPADPTRDAILRAHRVAALNRMAKAQKTREETVAAMALFTDRPSLIAALATTLAIAATTVTEARSLVTAIDEELHP